MFHRSGVPSPNSATGLAVVLSLFVLSTTAAAQAPVAAKLPTIAVMPLQAKGVTLIDADVITDAIATQLQQTGTQRVLERAQMDQILKEQGFQQSGICEGGECAVQMGKVLSVDRILVGSVGLVGHTYTLNLRMVSVGTGEVYRSDMKSVKGSIDDVLTRLVPETVNDLTSTNMAKERTASTESSSTEPQISSKSHWGWWLLGGAVVAGGAAAAVVLMNNGSGSQTPQTNPGPSTSYNSVTVQW